MRLLFFLTKYKLSGVLNIDRFNSKDSWFYITEIDPDSILPIVSEDLSLSGSVGLKIVITGATQINKGKFKNK